MTILEKFFGAISMTKTAIIHKWFVETFFLAAYKTDIYFY